MKLEDIKTGLKLRHYQGHACYVVLGQDGDIWNVKLWHNQPCPSGNAWPMSAAYLCSEVSPGVERFTIIEEPTGHE